MHTLEPTANVDVDEENAMDMNLINQDISNGATAGFKLKERGEAGGDWPLWSILLLGFRGMRDVCYAQTHTSDVNADPYRKEMGKMLQMPKYGIYAYHLGGREPKRKRLRSDAYKMLDHLDEINQWFNTQNAYDKLHWQHPSTIVKHCPHEYLSGGAGHNQPTKKNLPGKKKTFNPEAERWRAAFMEAITELMGPKPKIAKRLLSKMNQPDKDPNDSVADIGTDTETE